MTYAESLPNDIEWNEGDGLFRKKSGGNEKMCNGILEVTAHKKIINRKQGSEYEIVEGKCHYSNGKSEPFCFPVTQIISGKFMDGLPINFLIEMEKKRAVTQALRYSLQNQLTDKELVEVLEYDFGWNGSVYKYEDETQDSCMTEYECGMQIAKQIADSEGIVTGFILAGIHGPLNNLLLSAGIQHDFTTYVSGESGVGKTTLARRYCRYLHKQETAFSVASTKKELMKNIQEKSGVTVLVDDMNKSNSDRVVNHGVQILSDIIQLSSDSCQVLVDNKETSGNVHIITTAELALTNISTINRCFWIQMEKKIPDNCWRELNDFINKDGMWNFVRYFMEYINKNYSKLLKSVQQDYKLYLSTKKWTNCDIGGSRERIVNTYAVQRALFKILWDYLKKIGIDTKLIQEIFDMGLRSIYDGCKAVVDSIMVTLKKASNTEYLVELLKIFEKAIKFGRIAYKDKKYLNHPDEYDFLCNHEGYLSFNAENICDKIAHQLNLTDSSVTVRSLIKQLRDFSLVKINSEKEVSYAWGTNKRMVHVRGVDLLQVVKPDASYDDIRVAKTALNLLEEPRGISQVIEKFSINWANSDSNLGQSPRAAYRTHTS